VNQKTTLYAPADMIAVGTVKRSGVTTFCWVNVEKLVTTTGPLCVIRLRLLRNPDAPEYNATVMFRMGEVEATSLLTNVYKAMADTAMVSLTCICWKKMDPGAVSAWLLGGAVNPTAL